MINIVQSNNNVNLRLAESPPIGKICNRLGVIAVMLAGKPLCHWIRSPPISKISNLPCVVAVVFESSGAQPFSKYVSAQ